jgi:hypothetical protein
METADAGVNGGSHESTCSMPQFSTNSVQGGSDLAGVHQCRRMRALHNLVALPLFTAAVKASQLRLVD